MSYIKEQVAYIRGMAEGMELGQDTKESKIITAILALLDDMADSIDENGELVDDIRNNVEEIAGDLSDLEDVVFALNENNDGWVDEDDQIEDEYVELQCPHCGDNIFFDDEAIESKADLICPNCSGSVIVVDDGGC